MRRNVRGWTLLEVVVCLAILGTLFAIGMEAARPAIWRAKQQQSLSNLRQLYVAASLYQMDNLDSGNRRDDWPSVFNFGIKEWVRIDLTKFHSPCRWHPDYAETRPLVSYRIGEILNPDDEAAEAAFNKHGMNTFLFRDEHCTEHHYKLLNRFHPKVGLGVTIGGQLVVRKRYGVMTDDWWYDE